jgi:outer membrane receptor protein involved in Fe transport
MHRKLPAIVVKKLGVKVMQHKKLLSLAVSTALGLGTSFLITDYAVAQDEQVDDSDELLEEVIVTGSRIRNIDGFGRTSPVTVVGMEAITSTGLTRVEDVLNSLPSIETGLHSFDANGISRTAKVDLRGLGSFRTLVLFNGRRMQPGGVSATSVDVNQIPSAMIERIEVLTGGASATYGADAVAGVVNFIMRRVTGVEISAGISGYQHDNDNKYIQELMDRRNFDYPTGSAGIDGKAYNIDIVMGADFDDGRGNATVYATWRDNQELLQGSRDYSSCALNASGTACGGSSTAPVPNFFIAPLVDGVPDYSVSEWVSLQPDSSFVPYDGTNIYNYGPINHFMRPDTRWSMGAFIDYEINENAIAYLETNFATDRTYGQIAESGTFYAAEYYLPLDNSLFPTNFRNSLQEYWPGADEFGIYIGKRNVEGGPRSSNFEHDGFRIVTGLKGAINDDWDYDISYLYGQTNSSLAYINDLLTPNIGIAVDGDLCAATAGCIPYEVFTYQGVTPEAAQTLLGTAIATGRTSTRVINGFVTGDTGWNIGSADSIMVAGGFEHRIESYTRVSDTIFQEGSLAGQGGPTPGVDGSYSVLEFFGEANIPLLSGVPGAEALNLDLAYRYSDYSTSGGTSTYRVGVDWSPVDIVRVRAGYNRAVRAPNVAELFSTQALGLWSGVDPCANEDGNPPVYTQAQCANMGVTPEQYGNISASPAGQYNGLFGGNPLLDPEVADTYTLGVVFDPMEGMQVSVDYWRIDIEDTISNIGATTILEQCGLYGQLCDQIVRSASGNLWQGTSGYVVDTTINLGENKWEGVDLAMNWAIDALGGTFTTNLIGTYMMTKETVSLPADPTSGYDCVGLISTRCYPSPEWRHTASVAYDSNGWWSATLRWRYFQGVDYDGSTDAIAQSEMSKSQNYVDLNASFRFLENHDIVLGVNNVFDKEPPMVGGTLTTNANTIAGFYDTLGRYLYGKVTLRF